MTTTQTDRELDARVAEHVFDCWVSYIDVEPLCGCLDHRHAQHEGTYDLRAYTTDMNAAWQVVEAMKGPPSTNGHGFNWGFELSWLEDGEDRTGWVASFGDAESPICATAPLAICRAALAALDAEREG